MDPGDYHISGFSIFATLFLVLLNGFFVAAEFAMVKVRASQIELRAKTGNSIARVARGIMHNLDGYLAATQLGITIASLGLGVVGEEVVTALMINLFQMFNVQLAPGIITASHGIAFATIT